MTSSPHLQTRETYAVESRQLPCCTMSEVAEDPEPYTTCIDSELFLKIEARVHDGLPPLHSQSLRPVLRNSIVKSINMASSYAASFGFGVGEHYQNWLDACVQSGQSLPAILDPVVVVKQPAREAFADLVAKFGLSEDLRVFVAPVPSSDVVLGILLTFSTAAGRQIFCAKNYGARMKPDDLILGNSSKIGDQSAAGHFGEGVKSEINRLVQNGCSVKYYIANTVWSFVRQTAPECEVPELFAHMKASSSRYHDYVGSLIATGPDYSQQLLDESRFLSLQGQYDRIASSPTAGQKWSGMELLLAPQHHKKIFCHGIFVAECDSYNGFGLNYTGVKSIFPTLGLGRDRNLVNADFLVAGIITMAQDLQHTDQAAHQKLLEAVLNLMSHKVTALWGIVNNTRYLSSWSGGEWPQGRILLAQGLLDLIQQKHGSKAIPVWDMVKTSADQVSAEELQYLGFAAVAVSQLLHRLFEETGLLPKRRELLERSEADFVNQPEPPAELQQSLGELRTELHSKLSKSIQADTILFRNLPAGNTEIVRGFSEVYVIDANLALDIDKVHALCPDSTCQKAPGCSCLRDLLLFKMADAVASSQGRPRDKVLQGIMQCLLSDVPFQMPISTDQVNLNLGDQHEQPEADIPLATQPANAISPDQHQGNSPNSQQPSPLAAPDFSPTQTPSLSAPPSIDEPNDREDPSGFMKQLQDGIADVLRGQEYSSNLLPQRVRHVSGTGEPSEGNSRVKPCNRPQMGSDLCRSGILLAPGTFMKKPRYLFIAKGYDMAKWDTSNTVRAQNLFCLLLNLHDLFKAESTGFNVYFDPSDKTWAFNQNDKLWYNAGLDHCYDREQPTVRRLSWYLTVCHELAHHFVKSHDEEFARHFSHIAMIRSQAFYQLDQRLSAEAHEGSSNSKLNKIQSWLQRLHVVT